MAGQILAKMCQGPLRLLLRTDHLLTHMQPLWGMGRQIGTKLKAHIRLKEVWLGGAHQQQGVMKMACV